MKMAQWHGQTFQPGGSPLLQGTRACVPTRRGLSGWDSLDCPSPAPIAGYEGVYTNKAGKVREGSALFFRSDRFRLVAQVRPPSLLRCAWPYSRCALALRAMGAQVC